MNSTDHDLIIHRTIDVPPATLYRCWTKAVLLTKWFAPRPSIVFRIEMNVRPGGTSLVVVLKPDGTLLSTLSTYLEVVPNKRLVFTDAYSSAWQPSAKPFMTVDLTFEKLGRGKTGYTALVRHWTAEDRQKHLDMGFENCWNQSLDQLVELAVSL